jgi:integrase
VLPTTRPHRPRHPSTRPPGAARATHARGHTIARRIPRVTVYERAPGQLSVRWRERGRQREQRGFTTPEEAEDARFIVEARIRSGLPGARLAIKVSQLVQRWWDGHVITLGTSTIANYQVHVARVLDTLGDAYANELTPPQLIDWRVELEDMLGSARLVNECLKVLSGAYTKGVQWGLADTNPVLHVPRLAEDERNIYFPTRAEVLRLGMTAPNLAARVRLNLAAHAGPRPGEQLALQWRHINFERRRIRIEQSLKMNGQIGPTKTKKNRWIPGPLELFDLLAELRETTPFPEAGDFIITSPQGKAFHGTRWRANVLSDWRVAANAVQVEWRTLRHFFAALMASGGASLLMVSRYMGHASIKTTADRYAFLFDDDADAVFERIW